MTVSWVCSGEVFSGQNHGGNDPQNKKNYLQNEDRFKIKTKGRIWELEANLVAQNLKEISGPVE